MFLLERNSSEWHPINSIVNEKVSYHIVRKGNKQVKVATRTGSHSVLEAKVSDVDITSKRWLAATSAGLFTSTNDGKSWTGGPVMGKNDFVAVEANGEMIVAATHTNVVFSNDGGGAWQQAALPNYLTSIHGVTVTPDGQILVASREGAFRSSDSGATWEHMMNGLPDKNISSIAYDGKGKRLLATSMATGVVFESQDGGRSWNRGPDAGFPLRRISVVQGRFLAATPFDGVIEQPGNDSESASAASSN